MMSAHIKTVLNQDDGINTDFGTCPKCGAPVNGDKCEYCGAIFYDFVNIQSGSPTYIRMKLMGALHIFRAIVEDVEINQNNYESPLYLDNQKYVQYVEPQMPEITLRLKVVPDDRGIILEKRRKAEK